MFNKYSKTFWPGIAWFFIVNILLLIPGSDLPKEDNWMSKLYLDKWVHIGIFAVLAFLFMYPVLKSGKYKHKEAKLILLIAIATIVWGFCTEVMQKYLAIGRSFDWIDLLADSMGVLLALVVVRRV